MSSLLDQLLAPVPGNDDNTRIATLEAQMKTLLGGLNDGNQVGDWKLVRYPPPGWNSGNLILVGKYAVPNGFSVLKTDFPDLDALASAAGYPDGSDSTHVKLPDALGRSLVVVGTHADTALNKTENVALNNRTPIHGTTNNLSGGSASLTGSISRTDPGHAHSYNQIVGGGNNILGGSGFQGYVGPTSNNPAGVTVSNGTLGVSGGGVSGTIGPGGAGRPMDTPAYIIVGMLLLRVLP